MARVGPADVERFTVVSLLWGLGRIRGGDWDRPENCRSVTDNRLARGLEQRFEEGLDWEDTAHYEWVSEQLEEQGHFRGIESETEVKERVYPAIDDLYEDIRDEGYRPNRGTVYDGPETVESVHDLEPLVLVGRDGEVIWTEGFHRLVLARIVGVEGIPVYVLRRHTEWQATRDRLARTPAGERPAELEAYAAHPDVQDVV